MWNAWRKGHPDIQPDLRHAEISAEELSEAERSAAAIFADPGDLASTWPPASGGFVDHERFYWTNLSSVDLHDADLSHANLSQVYLFQANLAGADLTEARLYQAYLADADLGHAILTEAYLRNAELARANLWGAGLSGAILQEANLCQATLWLARSERAVFEKAKLRGANCRGANFFDANLVEADLAGANLRNADLNSADLFRAELSGANLTEADLSHASLVEARIEGAVLTRCRVYGVAAWGMNGAPKDQSGLIITPKDEPAIIVGDLDVAQFIYLLRRNYQKIRQVISTVGERGVLLLGRFADDRKSILEAVAEKLRGFGYLPIIFDFSKIPGQDYTETVLTLAGLSRFVIADITKPKSLPQEAQAIIPNMKIAFLRIMQSGEEAWSMAADHDLFDWVLGPFQYDDQDDLLQNLDKLVAKAETKHDDLVVRKARSVIQATRVADL